MTDRNRSLPPKPQPPEGYDCCGGGCADCDLRRYCVDLAEWIKQVAEIESGRGAVISIVDHRQPSIDHGSKATTAVDAPICTRARYEKFLGKTYRKISW